MALKQLLLVCLVTVTVCSEDTEKPFRGYKVIRVTPENEQQLQVLQNLEEGLELDFWKEPSEVHFDVDIQLSPNMYKKLGSDFKKQGIKFQVLQYDLQSSVDKESRSMQLHSFGTIDWYSKYHRLSEIVSKMKEISYQYRNAKMYSIGKSYQGRDMNVVEIKGKAKLNKPVFFMNCGMHAREWVTPATCMYFINQLLSRYGKDSRVTTILDKMDFYIMPVLNVDGYEYTWTGGRARFWRKTRSPGPSSRPWCIGTDPNRNWGHKWGLPGASTDPCSGTYRGRAAFSEVEVRNVKQYLESLKPRLVGYMDIHAYSQLWMIPYGYTTSPTPDNAELMRVSNAAIKAIRYAGYGTYYRAGSSSTIIYKNSGGSKDWTYGTLGIKYSFALELRDTGRYGFMLPERQILPTGKETLAGVLKMAEEMKI